MTHFTGLKNSTAKNSENMKVHSELDGESEFHIHEHEVDDEIIEIDEELPILELDEEVISEEFVDKETVFDTDVITQVVKSDDEKPKSKQAGNDDCFKKNNSISSIVKAEFNSDCSETFGNIDLQVHATSKLKASENLIELDSDADKGDVYLQLTDVGKQLVENKAEEGSMNKDNALPQLMEENCDLFSTGQADAKIFIDMEWKYKSEESAEKQFSHEDITIKLQDKDEDHLLDPIDKIHEHFTMKGFAKITQASSVDQQTDVLEVLSNSSSVDDDNHVIATSSSHRVDAHKAAHFVSVADEEV